MRWSIGKEKQRGVIRYVIRRWVDGELKRLPVADYKRIRDDYSALVEYVKRLNAPIDLKERVDFKHAFINDELLSEYQEFLLTKIASEDVAKTEVSYVKYYFLHFFITIKSVINPAKWIELESKWLAYLLSDPKGPEQVEKRLKGIKAETTKRKVVAAANRFMAWLHKRRPEELPKVKFETISKSKFNDIREQRKLDGDTNDHCYIPKADFEKIIASPPENIKPFVMLMARYGLRRQESLGVLPGDVKKTHLFVQRQLRRVGKHGPLKGRDMRKVNHWFSSAKEAYLWVEAAQKHVMHPRTLAERWTKYMRSLDFEYTMHDLRHTWTTDAMRQFGKSEPRDVQLAAGHKDLGTTMKYLHDDRNVADEAYIPDDVA